jgi:uncharacterized membrane protein
MKKHTTHIISMVYLIGVIGMQLYQLLVKGSITLEELLTLLLIVSLTFGNFRYWREII